MRSKQRPLPRRAGAKSPESVVRSIVSRTCGLPSVRSHHSFARDLYVDIAMRTELLMAVELAFRVDISTSEAATLDTVGDLIALVRRKTRSFDEASGDAAAAPVDVSGGTNPLGPPVRLRTDKA